MASTAPTIGQPSSKEKKYDRQLRLWGANGQNRLEAAHIALFGATATGCEVLKNLILPSVGQFTIIDDKLVEETDLGSNFFLTEDSVGKPRAEKAAATLAELNPDVKGFHMQDSLTNLLATKPELFQPETSPFTHLVVVSPFTTADILKLSSEIPTFLVYSIGFVTSLRLALPTHAIVETHPDSLVDLRLLNPWPALVALSEDLAKNLDVHEIMGGMSDHVHGHVPYVVLLLHYLSLWKSEHDGKPPLSYDEKTAFKDLIRNNMRTHVSGGSEENYDEAIATSLKNLRKAEISSEAKSVYNDPRCIDPGASEEEFWIIAHAVKQFVETSEQGDGLLPLSGAVPDMKADSSTYVKLQHAYRDRALRDAKLVYENVQSKLKALDRPEDSIDFAAVSLFAKNANFVRAINYRPLSSEYTPDAQHKQAVSTALQNWDADDSLINDYIAIHAWQEYLSTHSRVPGCDDVTYEEDVKAVEELARKYLKSLDIEEDLKTRAVGMCREVVRPGGGELHNIASLAGGIAAQEIVKIITKQYVPANNVVVFDGIKSRVQVFEV